MKRTILRNGETWLVWPTKRGFRAECEKLELSATAPTLAALLAELDFLMEAMLV